MLSTFTRKRVNVHLAAGDSLPGARAEAISAAVVARCVINRKRRTCVETRLAAYVQKGSCGNTVPETCRLVPCEGYWLRGD